MEKTKRKGKKKVWMIVLAILAILGAGMGIAVAATAPGRNELKNLSISDLNFKKLRDGVYTGKYTGTKDSLRNAAVQVTLVSGSVTKIQVTEGSLANEKQGSDIGKGKTINNLFDNIIKAQSLKVDVISGATLTSKAHLKAVENALEQAAAK